MSEYSGDETKKRYEALPPEIKKLLYSPEMSFIVQQIGQKHQLHIDQIDALNTETGEVMLGFADTNEFINNLIEMVGIDKTKAEAVANDVNDMLFVKIRDAMKKVYEQNKTTPTPMSAPSPMPSSTPISSSQTIKPPLATSLPLVTKPPVPPPNPNMQAAETMLTEKTIQTGPTAPPATPKPAPATPPATKPEPPKPQDYKADPYREPAE